ncbi:malonic semialdehyde reductase [Rhizobium sp. CF080]|uniref:malonic semialdehyde reductase n=1 Tax=Rhizobium sp. (strain CF080) TaxID=1144310 RepID=UPI00056CC1B7|nr:malonic semialdehyde reductase [Rhizobium sp. CF080]
MTTGKSGLDAAGLDTIFLEAHTYYSWLDKPVSVSLLRQVYDLARMGPTSGNCCPMRIVFVNTPEGRARLKPGLRPGNVDQTMSAPATAIIGTDMEFYKHIPRLAPHAVARIAVYEADQELAQRAAFRNATLQGAYLIMAARSLGLDCGPMSGFLHDVVDEEFFAGTSVKSNFLINIGYGNPASVRPRGDRFDFDEVCQIA